MDEIRGLSWLIAGTESEKRELLSLSGAMFTLNLIIQGL
jgi:hypothetical protein